MKKLPLVTIETVKAAVGRTWFSFSDVDGCISLDTRDHGNVGSEEAGAADIAEGKRIFALVKKVFSPSRFLVTADVIDEWVTVVVRREMLDPKERLVISQKKSRLKINDKVNKIAAALTAQGRAPVHFYFDSGYQAEGHRYRLAKLQIVVPFGEVVSAMYTSFRYKTADVAEAAARDVIPLITGFPISEWQMEPTRPLYERTALNGSGRILDRSSDIRFTAILNIK